MFYFLIQLSYNHETIFLIHSRWASFNGLLNFYTNFLQIEIFGFFNPKILSLDKRDIKIKTL